MERFERLWQKGSELCFPPPRGTRFVIKLASAVWKSSSFRGKKKPKKQNKIAYSNKCPISKIIQLPCAGTETNIPASLKMLREPETNEGGRLLCSRKLSSWPWTPIGALRESQDTLVPALPNSGMWALGKGRGELTTSATLSIVGWKVW